MRSIAVNPPLSPIRYRTIPDSPAAVATISAETAKSYMPPVVILVIAPRIGARVSVTFIVVIFCGVAESIKMTNASPAVLVDTPMAV